MHPSHALPGAFIVKPGVRLSAVQVCWAVHPQPQYRAGTRESPQAGWPAGRVVPAAPVRTTPCILGLVVCRPAPTFPLTKVCKYSWLRRWEKAVSPRALHFKKHFPALKNQDYKSKKKKKRKKEKKSEHLPFAVF